MYHPCVHLLCICMENITLLKFCDKEVLNSEAYTLSTYYTKGFSLGSWEHKLRVCMTSIRAGNDGP